MAGLSFYGALSRRFLLISFDDLRLSGEKSEKIRIRAFNPKLSTYNLTSRPFFVGGSAKKRNQYSVVKKQRPTLGRPFYFLLERIAHGENFHFLLN